MQNKHLIEIARNVQKRMAEGLRYDAEYTDQDFSDVIEENVVKELEYTYLSSKEQKEVSDYVFNATRRHDILQPLLEDPRITEIMVNGAGKLFIEVSGSMQQLPGELVTAEKLEELIQILVARTNRTVNESNPIVDFRLEDGSRVNIVMKPLAVNGPCITIRKFPKEPLTLDKLIENGTITEEVAGFLKEAVQSRNNILVSGGTSSGKTTLLNVLAACIPKQERIVTIEDSAELQMNGIENLVTLEIRNRNCQGDGAITIRSLVKTALRMRPDRIIVGEVRDQAALDMIQALNSGHDGSMSTIHANSAEDALLRLETMALTAEVIPLQAIQRQIASAIQVVIHLERDAQSRRKVSHIIAICGVEEGHVITRELYHGE